MTPRGGLGRIGDWTRTGRGQLVVIALGTVLVGLVGSQLSGYLLSLAILILFFAYLGQCWNIMGGYAGQFSFGHAAFVGLGAYTSTVLSIKFGVNPWLGMLAGGLVSLVVGLAVGKVCFRYKLRGPFFALTTLAVAESLRTIFNNWSDVGGALGLIIPLRGDSLLDFQFRGRMPYFLIILVMTGLITALVAIVMRTRFGYMLRAIREDEEAAASLGVPFDRYKLLATGLSAFLTALGGTFYAQYLLFIEPPLVFGTAFSVEMVIRPLVGGLGTIGGPLLGSVLLTPLSEFTRSVFRGMAGVDLMLFGAILIVVILYMPDGIVGWWERRRLRRRLRTVTREEQVAEREGVR